MCTERYFIICVSYVHMFQFHSYKSKWLEEQTSVWSWEGGVVKTALYAIQVWNKKTAEENTEEIKVKVCSFFSDIALLLSDNSNVLLLMTWFYGYAINYYRQPITNLISIVSGSYVRMYVATHWSCSNQYFTVYQKEQLTWRLLWWKAYTGT